MSNYKNQKWVNKKTDAKNNIKIENAILNKAKKLRLTIKLKSVIKIQPQNCRKKWQNLWSEKNIFYQK